MFLFILRKAFIRFLLLFISGAVISSVLAVLSLFNIITGSLGLTISLMVGAIIFWFFNFRKQRKYYITFIENEKMYYRIYDIAFLMYGLTCALTFIFSPNYFYTWFFAISKFLRYTNGNINISTPKSAAVFLFITYVNILCSKISHKKLVDYYIKAKSR